MDSLALGLMGIVSVGVGVTISQARDLSTARLVICVGFLLGLAVLATVITVMD